MRIIARLMPRISSRRVATNLGRLGLPHLRSRYGPLLVTCDGDETYLYCLTGAYGDFIPAILRQRSKAYSFLDIGANIGIFSLIAAAQPLCRQTIAIEPNPDVFQILQQNVALNRLDIRSCCCAIAAPGELEDGLQLYVPHGHSGKGSLLGPPTDDGTASRLSVDGRGVEFLDGLAAEIEGALICKIDVEGGEPQVLSLVLESALAPNIDQLIVELNFDLYVKQAFQAKRMLTEHGWILTAVSDHAARVQDTLWTRP
jgi:FkbM family methyltransferase